MSAVAAISVWEESTDGCPSCRRRHARRREGQRDLISSHVMVDAKDDEWLPAGPGEEA